MRAYAYEVTEQSPSVLKDQYPLGTKFNAENAVTLAEAVDPNRAGGALFPDEAAVIAKAEAQRNISAVHDATAWVKKLIKDGKPAPSAADVEARIQAFRYKKVTVRDPNAPPTPAGVVNKVNKEKAAQFDAGRATLREQILDGKFGATALEALIGAGMADVEEIRAAAATRDAEKIPAAVRKLLGQ
jgi:hypothetical protein